MSRYFFFFSSRRRHTRYWRDWSSDVCSSDLPSASGRVVVHCGGRGWVVVGEPSAGRRLRVADADVGTAAVGGGRSEERRVGKSVDLGGRRIIKKKKNSRRERD